MQFSIFQIVFTFCIAYIIFYWAVTIPNGVSYLWQMVRTIAAEDAEIDIPEGSVGRGRGRGQAPCGNPPPPPPPHPMVSIEQLLAMQNELMSVLVQNDACRGGGGGGALVAPPSQRHEHILLRLLGNSPADPFWGEGPP
jgi:hypothetical protein